MKTSKITRLWVLAALAACASTDPGGSTNELINGRLADEGEFPSTVAVAYFYDYGNGDGIDWPFCTAAKVGPRHILIAAHCVSGYDAQTGEVGVHSYARPGATLSLTNGTDLRFPIEGLRPFVVEETHVFPGYLEACAAAPESCGYITSLVEREPDVALIVAQEDIEGIPSARVDLRPVLVGEPLAIQGYGCRDSVNTPETRTTVELHTAPTLAIPSDSGAFRDVTRGYRPSDYREHVGPSYVVTPGPQVDFEQGGLCPGDSGGPLYRRQGRNDLVVGVNANYEFVLDPQDPTQLDGIPLTNWHTRLDAFSKENIGRWLAERGAQVAFSPLLGVYFEPTSCGEGFERRAVGFGGYYCVDGQGRVDGRLVSLEMISECALRREAAGEDTEACVAETWDEEEFLALRGEGPCATGASFDFRLGTCISDFFVQGALGERVTDACDAIGEPCGDVKAPTATVHRALTHAPVRPVVECVQATRDGRLSVRFGYESDALRPVHLPPGRNNHFGDVVDREQPADFLPGRHRRAARIDFAEGESVTWTLTSLDGTTTSVTADATSPRCR
ncbi:MAG: S1 family peptidase [Myxococcales bacterium]|nr:S1 family peptidase [Myxococcales bacterium]